MCRVCDICFSQLSSGGAKKVVSTNLSASLTDKEMTEAQNTLARRATKKFGKNSDANIPQIRSASMLEQVSVAPVNKNNPEADVAKLSNTKGTRRVKKKRTRARRKTTTRSDTERSQKLGSSEDSSEDFSEEFDDIPLPDFFPPPLPDDDPYEYDSEESSGYLSPPPDDAPLPPIVAC